MKKIIDSFPTVTYQQAKNGLSEGGRFFAIRGVPLKNNKVEVFFLSLYNDEDGTPPYPFLDYSAGFWSDESCGEEDSFPLDDVEDEFSLSSLFWYVLSNNVEFPYGYTPEYTVSLLFGVKLDDSIL